MAKSMSLRSQMKYGSSTKKTKPTVIKGGKCSMGASKGMK